MYTDGGTDNLQEAMAIKTTLLRITLTIWGTVREGGGGHTIINRMIHPADQFNGEPPYG